MSFDPQSTHSRSQPAPIFVSPAMLSMILVVAVFLFATYHAFSTQQFSWLALIPSIPLAVYLINRKDVFFLMIVGFTAANIWVPLAGNDVPIHISMRLALCVVLIGTSIITRQGGGKWDLLRLSTTGWLVIILATMMARGTGIRQLGSSLWGGKNYVLLFSAVFFFLIVPRFIQLTRNQWKWIIAMLVLLPVIPLAADLLYIASGGKLYFLYYVFKPGGGVAETVTSITDESSAWRVQGVAQIDLLLPLFVVSPWLGRSPHGKMILALMFSVTIILGGLSGFRGTLLRIIGLTIIYLWFRHPGRRVSMLVVTLSIFLGLVGVAHFAGRSFPPPVQRVMTVLPYANVDPFIRMNADHSSNWRIKIWDDVIRTELRPHLILGRGFSFNPNKLFPLRTQYFEEWQVIQNAVTTGDFHSGPLIATVLFGLPGFAFLLLIMFSALLKHWRIHHLEWQDPLLRHIHFVFFASFLYSTLSFLLIYGDLSFMMIGYFMTLTFMEILAAGRQRDEENQRDGDSTQPKLVSEPTRNRVIRFT